MSGALDTSSLGCTVGAAGRSHFSGSDLIPAIGAVCRMRHSSLLWSAALLVTLMFLVAPPRVMADPNGPSLSADISGEGRYVAFASLASNLVAGDTNGTVDIFVRDRWADLLTRVSIPFPGLQANGPSADPSISGDGRYVAFESSASNLVRGDTNGQVDAFVHDRATGATTRVSVGLNGRQLLTASRWPPGYRAGYAPDISGDGRYIAFASQQNNAKPANPNESSPNSISTTERPGGASSRSQQVPE